MAITEETKEKIHKVVEMIKKHAPAMLTAESVNLTMLEMRLAIKTDQWRKAGLTEDEIVVLCDYYRMEIRKRIKTLTEISEDRESQ